MRQVTLGKTGLRVSAVGFGGIPIQRLNESEAVEVIQHALQLGVNFIDTAAGYGDSQNKIGKAIAGRREGLVLATKSGETTREGILRDVERARREMGVDVIDLFQLHNVAQPAKWDRIREKDGALAGLTEARDKGDIRHIGFTSHSREMALGLVDEPIFETVQFPFNLVTAEPADDLIPKARRNGLGFIVMKPLCGGQYDNARFAFKFLNSYPDLVPIPGIEATGEIDEIVQIVEDGGTLQGAELAEAREVAERLGKLFCRRCGYCQPCPQGVPVQAAMIFESMVKRLPRDRIASGMAPRILEQTASCTQCGACEEKCPYDLPIIETIGRSRKLAESLVSM